MKHTSIVAGMSVVLTAGLWAAQLTAGGKDDKKVGAVPPAVTEEYRLGAGDKLRIEVYKDTQLSQSVQVRPDGKVTLPLIGDMAAAGLTPIELRDHIAGSLKEYVTNPTVTVIVFPAKEMSSFAATGSLTPAHARAARVAKHMPKEMKTRFILNFQHCITVSLCPNPAGRHQ